jgi:hypothetical protein
VSSAAAAASTPLLAALGPIGWGILASAGVGALYGRWKLAQHRNKRKEAMLNDLPDYSQRVINSYQNQADEYIKKRVGSLLEVVDNHIERLDNSINSLEQRLLTGEYRDRDRRIENLKRLTQQCLDVDTNISEFYKTVASLQPGVSAILFNSHSNESSEVK